MVETWRRTFGRDEFDLKQRGKMLVRAGGPDNIHCEGCGRRLRRGDAYEFDHVTPLCLGGETTVENGKLLGAKCCHTNKSGNDSRASTKADEIAKRDLKLKRPKKKLQSRNSFQQRHEYQRPAYWAGD
jgi:hypothetical protein